MAVADRLVYGTETVILQSAKLNRFRDAFHVFNLYPELVDKVVEKPGASL